MSVTGFSDALLFDQIHWEWKKSNQTQKRKLEMKEKGKKISTGGVNNKTRLSGRDALGWNFKYAGNDGIYGERKRVKVVTKFDMAWKKREMKTSTKAPDCRRTTVNEWPAHHTLHSGETI